jgi:hypothetical protein
MMGGGAFIRLKVGRLGPESAKQTEIRLAILPKILWIGGVGRPKTLANGAKDMQWSCFHQLPLDMANFAWIGHIVI